MTVDDTLEPCFFCSKPNCDIFIRLRLFGRWRTVAICDAEWYARNPDREPVRLRAPHLTEESCNQA